MMRTVNKNDEVKIIMIAAAIMTTINNIVKKFTRKIIRKELRTTKTKK